MNIWGAIAGGFVGTLVLTTALSAAGEFGEMDQALRHVSQELTGMRSRQPPPRALRFAFRTTGDHARPRRASVGESVKRRAGAPRRGGLESPDLDRASRVLGRMSAPRWLSKQVIEPTADGESNALIYTLRLV